MTKPDHKARIPNQQTFSYINVLASTKLSFRTLVAARHSMDTAPRQLLLRRKVVNRLLKNAGRPQINAAWIIFAVFSILLKHARTLTCDEAANVGPASTPKADQNSTEQQAS
jgi:hypothetical protein